MKKNIFKIILPFVLSCNPKIKQINNENSKLLNMNCQEIITEFSYPEHLNSLDNLNYKCYDSVNINIFKDHQPYFNDKNYAIFYHHSYIKILLDKKHNQIMCFRMQDGLTEFKKESIHTIYFLDSNFFPLYKITNSTDEGKTLVLKFVYDNKNKTLDSKILNLNFNKNIKELDYDDIINLSEILKNNQYTLSSEGFSYDPYFLNHPQWDY